MRYLTMAMIAGTCAIASAADTEKGTKTVKTLPAPNMRGTVSVEETIAKRRSIRSFSNKPLTDELLGQLLWSAQGITEERRGFRAAPSAGATYPLETYLVTAEGVFRYLPRKHALESVKTGDVRAALCAAALGQDSVRTAPASIVFTAVPERTSRRYGRRAGRYIAMEIGHAAQNVQLQAVALGLGSVPVGAFDDAKVAEVIGSVEGEEALYIIPVGYPDTR